MNLSKISACSGTRIKIVAEIAEIETQEEFKEKSCSIVKHCRWSERARKSRVQ